MHLYFSRVTFERALEREPEPVFGQAAQVLRAGVGVDLGSSDGAKAPTRGRPDVALIVLCARGARERREQRGADARNAAPFLGAVLF